MAAEPPNKRARPRNASCCHHGCHKIALWNMHGDALMCSKHMLAVPAAVPRTVIESVTWRYRDGAANEAVAKKHARSGEIGNLRLSNFNHSVHTDNWATYALRPDRELQRFLETKRGPSPPAAITLSALYPCNMGPDPHRQGPEATLAEAFAHLFFGNSDANLFLLKMNTDLFEYRVDDGFWITPRGRQIRVPHRLLCSVVESMYADAVQRSTARDQYAVMLNALRSGVDVQIVGPTEAVYHVYPHRIRVHRTLFTVVSFEETLAALLMHDLHKTPLPWTAHMVEFDEIIARADAAEEPAQVPRRVADEPVQTGGDAFWAGANALLEQYGFMGRYLAASDRTAERAAISMIPAVRDAGYEVQRVRLAHYDGTERPPAASACTTTPATPAIPDAADKPAQADSTRSCVVCMNALPNIAVVPCGHVVLCRDCARHGFATCPVCRRPAQQLLRLFM